jgi:ABC-type branched-subunit amino acid transport system substrate-binding protein
MGREMGIHALYATQSTLYDEKALADYVNKLNGVMISGPYFDANNPDDSIRTFGEQYKARFNKAPSVWAAYGYDAADIMINAILIATKAGVPTKEKLANQVFNGVTGRTEIKPDRSIVKEMVLYTIENNKFIRK